MVQTLSRGRPQAEEIEVLRDDAEIKEGFKKQNTQRGRGSTKKY
jgi:hypothetical protein